MNKKKATVWLVLAAGLTVLTGIGVAAFSEVGLLFDVSTGKVAVHLEEYTKQGEKEIPWEDGQVVLPGGTVSKIPRIFNDGEDCYVRARVEFDSEKESEEPLSDGNLLGISEDWLRIGEYYYYAQVLKEEETVNFFEGIQIPSTWRTGVDDGNRWNAKVQVDAIQAEFFQPDFSSEDPWKLGEEIKILEAPQEEPMQAETAMEPVVLEIAAEAKGFSVNSQEFFQTMESFLPGRSQTGSLELKNQTNQQRTVYLRAEILEQNELLEKLELEIRKKESGQEETLYRGPLLAESLQEYRKLAEVGKKENVQVEFQVGLPVDADNQYAARQGKVKFYLTTEAPPKVVKAVTTKDATGIWPVWAAALSAAAVFGSVIYRRIRRKTGGDI